MSKQFDEKSCLFRISIFSENNESGLVGCAQVLNTDTDSYGLLREYAFLVIYGLNRLISIQKIFLDGLDCIYRGF